MTREEFRRRNGEPWKRLERLLVLIEARRERGGLTSWRIESGSGLAEFDLLYRLICKHLTLARQRMYGRELVGYLNALALRAHRELYGRRATPWGRVLDFALAGFPAAVRANLRLVAIAALLFAGPLAVMLFAVRSDPDLIHTVMRAEQVRQFEQMYEPGSDYRTVERQSAGDLEMFGFYIMNNVGVAFQTFAGGVLFGAGSIFFLLFNGVVLGSVTAHVWGIGYGSTFFPFVVGHSAFELTSIVLAGAAGLNLGRALVRPGRIRRSEALQLAARQSVAIVCGAAVLLVAAAFVEAFWSSTRAVSDPVKYAAGSAMWLATLAYFWLGGRRRAA